MRARWCAVAVVAVVGCGGPAGPGGACSADNPDACQDGLVCDTDSTCRKPAGAECNAGAGTSECVATAICDDSVEPAVCALQEGEACGSGEGGGPCAAGLSCYDLESGGAACFPPVLLAGTVTGSDTDGEGLGGAHVIALDDERAPITDVAVSAADGSYELEIPVLRQSDGAPISTTFTLRASAADYQTFPGGLRQSLPINANTATKEAEGWVVQSALTDVLLIALPVAGLAKIVGRVVAGAASSGVLVVAGGTAGGMSAVSDLDGDFTVFNVADDDYTVRGFKADLQLEPVDVTVAGGDVTSVELNALEVETTTLTGGLQKADAPNFEATSIVLAVKSTFDPVLGRGDIPPGLRAPRSGAPDITGAWTISGIPDGEYIILAAFENDGEVRDPDTSIGGTDILEVSLGEAERGTSIGAGSFKVTDALPVITPGANAEPEGVSEPFDLTWGPDSGVDYYHVQVFDALGEIAWETTQTHQGPASSDQSITYAGAPLTPGMFYQFRIRSRLLAGPLDPPDLVNDTVLSMTEDLLGVFFLAP